MNTQTETADNGMTLETIADWLRHRAGSLYGGEAVTQLEHALQCATLAQSDGATPSLITASLLHDIGHLADSGNDVSDPHGALAAGLLKRLFGPEVTEPIRLHIDAKRYLCLMEPAYHAGLSEASKRSLLWQGGPYSVAEAKAFIVQPYADDALRLRRWDDAAKIPHAVTPDLDHFIRIMRTVRTGLTVLEAA
jgi:phosphonate degradation associated HDIG domain protein